MTDAQAERLWTSRRPGWPATPGSWRSAATTAARPSCWPAPPPGHAPASRPSTPTPATTAARSRSRAAPDEGEADHQRVPGQPARRRGPGRGSATCACPPRRRWTRSRASIDLLYVDGAHRYAPARDDIARWGARVRPGGLLLIHDSFSSVGVTLAQARLLFFGSRVRVPGPRRLAGRATADGPWTGAGARPTRAPAGPAAVVRAQRAGQGRDRAAAAAGGAGAGPPPRTLALLSGSDRARTTASNTKPATATQWAPDQRGGVVGVVAAKVLRREGHVDHRQNDAEQHRRARPAAAATPTAAPQHQRHQQRRPGGGAQAEQEPAGQPGPQARRGRRAPAATAPAARPRTRRAASPATGARRRRRQQQQAPAAPRRPRPRAGSPRSPRAAGRRPWSRRGSRPGRASRWRTRRPPRARPGRAVATGPPAAVVASRPGRARTGRRRPRARPRGGPGTCVPGSTTVPPPRVAGRPAGAGRAQAQVVHAHHALARGQVLTAGGQPPSRTAAAGAQRATRAPGRRRCRTAAVAIVRRRRAHGRVTAAAGQRARTARPRPPARRRPSRSAMATVGGVSPRGPRWREARTTSQAEASGPSARAAGRSGRSGPTAHHGRRAPVGGQAHRGWAPRRAGRTAVSRRPPDPRPACACASAARAGRPSRRSATHAGAGIAVEGGRGAVAGQALEAARRWSRTGRRRGRRPGGRSPSRGLPRRHRRPGVDAVGAPAGGSEHARSMPVSPSSASRMRTRRDPRRSPGSLVAHRAAARSRAGRGGRPWCGRTGRSGPSGARSRPRSADCSSVGGRSASRTSRPGIRTSARPLPWRR